MAPDKLCYIFITLALTNTSRQNTCQHAGISSKKCCIKKPLNDVLNNNLSLGTIESDSYAWLNAYYFLIINLRFHIIIISNIKVQHY